MSETVAINHSSVEHQINKLKSQQLLIQDEKQAKDALMLYGYSNLIKSYRDPYFIIDGGQKTYRSGVSFEQISSLYLLDKNLRNAVMASMLALEEHIKEAAANVVAKSFGTDHNDYLKFKNYQNKRKKKIQFSLANLLNKMRGVLNTDKDPIHHYMQKYNTAPPWILFKSVYLSTIINFIDQFKALEKVSMANSLYELSELNISQTDLTRLMMDTLFTCNDYRNTAAHGGRIYNHVCRNTISSYGNMPLPFHGFSQLLYLLRLLKYKDPYLYLQKALDEQINRHCSIYPADVTYLGQSLNINITPISYVYIANKNNKYHTNPHCSGILNPKQMELSSAESLGYIPCKRCCKI